MSYLKQVFDGHKRALLSKANVTGVGIGYKFIKNVNSKQPGIVVMVNKKEPLSKLRSQDRIPPTISGISTDVWEGGGAKFHFNRRGFLRPARPGCGISNYKPVGVGTFGAVVKDYRNQPLILSCNHIIANLSNGQDNRCKIGDPILQPGIGDGGTLKNRIGFLSRYIPVRYNTDEINLVDAAVAEPDNQEVITPLILSIGMVTGTGQPVLGLEVLKSGRTTGLTRGEIVAYNVVTKFGDEELGLWAWYGDLIATTSMCEPGDSGALLVSAGDKKALGIEVGGNFFADFYCNISHVLRLLRVKF